MCKKRAKIFELIEDTRERQHLTRQQLAEKTGIDLKWLNDFINDGILADQVYRLHKIEDELGISPMPPRYYKCEKVNKE